MCRSASLISHTPAQFLIELTQMSYSSVFIMWNVTSFTSFSSSSLALLFSGAEPTYTHTLSLGVMLSSAWSERHQFSMWVAMAKSSMKSICNTKNIRIGIRLLSSHMSWSQIRFASTYLANLYGIEHGVWRVGFVFFPYIDSLINQQVGLPMLWI